MNPPNYIAFWARGNGYRAKVNYPDAIAQYTQAIKFKNNFPPLFVTRGTVYAEEKNYPAAFSDFEAALRIKPDFVGAFYQRCWTRALQNSDLAAAMADCNKALSLEPKSSGALESRGLVYFRLGDFPKAIADLDAVLKISPQSAPAIYYRGIVKIHAGDAADGRADIASALAINSHAGDEMNRIGLTP